MIARGALLAIVAASGCAKPRAAPPPDAVVAALTPAREAEVHMARPAAGLLPDVRPSEGCSAVAAPGGFRDELTIRVNGQQRRYALSVPAYRASQVPLRLVFAFHGDARRGSDVRAALALEDHANGEAIFVYPDGLGRTWRNTEPPASNVDLALFDALLEEIARTYCVDRARVFVTGFSRGAFFTNQLACRRPVRAIAPLAGGGPYRLPGEARGTAFACPAAPPAVLVIHGEDDRNVRVRNGRQSRDHWRRLNGCAAATTPITPKPCVALEGCTTGRPVVYCQVPRLAHTVWRGAPEAIWSFFRAF